MNMENKKKEKKENINKETSIEEAVENNNQEIDLLGNRIKTLEESLFIYLIHLNHRRTYYFILIHITFLKYL